VEEIASMLEKVSQRKVSAVKNFINFALTNEELQIIK